MINSIPSGSTNANMLLANAIRSVNGSSRLRIGGSIRLRRSELYLTRKKPTAPALSYRICQTHLSSSK